MEYIQLPHRDLRHAIASPFIVGMLVPIVFLDICVEIYHHICFPLYGIERVRRRHYIAIDRHKLRYLTFMQKLYCMYCGYVNGLFQYWVEIAARTEKYWCGIQHRKRTNFHAPPHHTQFVPYGDKDAFEKAYKKKSEQ